MQISDEAKRAAANSTEVRLLSGAWRIVASCVVVSMAVWLALAVTGSVWQDVPLVVGGLFAMSSIGFNFYALWRLSR